MRYWVTIRRTRRGAFTRSSRVAPAKGAKGKPENRCSKSQAVGGLPGSVLEVQLTLAAELCGSSRRGIAAEQGLTRGALGGHEAPRLRDGWPRFPWREEKELDTAL